MTTVFTNRLEHFEPQARHLLDSHPVDDGTDDDNLACSVLGGLPKVSSKPSNSATSQSKNDELWTIRQVPTGEEQLYARGKSVYWTRNSLTIKSFNMVDQISKIFWANFNGSDHVCIAMASGLSIFDHMGRHYQMLLPFSYKDIYTTCQGLVIERNCDLSQEDINLPVLFTLTHPNREVSPIIFRPSTRTTQNSRILSYSVTNFISLVSCHETLPLCLMYNSQDCQHSIWRMRPTTDEELDEFTKLNEESICTQTFSQSNCSLKSEPFSHSSFNISSRQKSGLINSSASTINFSPKLDLKAKHSTLGNLVASRLGTGYNHMIGEVPATSITASNMRSMRDSMNTFNTASTPNRNRLINYLRDNIEEPILPELTIEQVWADSTSNSLRAQKFFSSKDIVDEEYMVIVIPASSQIKVMRYEKTASDRIGSLCLGRSIHIPGIDAAHIASLKMMVVMGTAKNFILYSGADRITSVTLGQSIPENLRLMPASSPANLRNSVKLEMSPIQASSAKKRMSFGERSSLGSESSFRQLFQTLSPVPHAIKYEGKASSSPVCIGEARQIEHVIGQTLYLKGTSSQRFKVAIPSIYQTSCVEKLLNSMKSLVSREVGLLIITSWYQARRSGSQPDMMKAIDELNLFKNWFINCLGIEKILFGPERTLSLDMEIFLKTSNSSPNKKSRRIRESINDPYIGKIYSFFFAMHLVFEDLMMTHLNYEISACLSELLVVLACILKQKNYQNYYWSKFPLLQEKYGWLRDLLENASARIDSLVIPSYFTKLPPSAMDFLSKLITIGQLDEISMNDELITPYPNIPHVTDQTYTIISLFCSMFTVNVDRCIVDIGISQTNYPTKVSFKSRPCRSSVGDRRVVEMLVKFKKDRNYLSRLPCGLNLYLWDAILNCRESPPPDWCETCFDLIGRKDLVNLVCGRAQAVRGSEDDTLKLLFPDDIRVSEAQRMVASDIPVEFGITQRQGATEEESRDETHRHLYLLNVRTMGMPIGRGAICLRTYSPVIGESFEVPRLELSGRSLAEDRLIEYNHDLSVYPWPFFHNGVAAGLTICESTASDIIDSTWINYNRPRSNIPYGDARDRDLTTANINNEHAGFLFALGLNGHLEKLSLMALHDYLCQNNDLTKLAILLGMSAAKRGSRDTNIIKVLSIHVDALLPPNSTELDVSAPVHAASIIGVGLLYQGSGDSHISRVLLEEIGRLPGPEANSHVDRESYSLSAGLAFGLVNLSKGGSTTISSSDQLRLYMLGGKRKPLTVAQKQRYFKQDCHRGEEEYINTHVTSPGGTLGLGLMYHRSENVSVAEWMKAPDTQTLLEYVRPDFLILRMLSYGLIMWNKIEPSEAYIDSHIPKIVSQHAFQRNSSPVQLVSATTNQSIDYELISQAYCNIVAGCCMTIAMRFAGTADKSAYKAIYKHTKMLIALGNKPILAEQAGKSCIESCLSVLVTSLAVVMAGTGDLGVMRVCRYMRSRLTQQCVFYGSHMAVHLALGILFLGSCRYSFSTSPEAIGALVCALYPIYPNHSSDNRYHLQALRHLYVLAAEPRLLIPRDIMTNRPVYARVALRQKMPEGQLIELKLKLPCLLPEVDTIENLRMDDDCYWQIEINDPKVLMKCLFQEHGYLSVKQKAHSSNNQLVEDIETYIIQDSQSSKQKGSFAALNSLREAALNDRVRTDRVEQYSSLSKLFKDTKHIDDRYSSLVLEQLYIATLLGKLDTLQPVLHRILDQLSQQDVESLWVEYLNTKNWTKTSSSVAHFVALNNLRFYDGVANLSVIKTSDMWLELFS